MSQVPAGPRCLAHVGKPGVSAQTGIGRQHVRQRRGDGQKTLWVKSKLTVLVKAADGADGCTELPHPKIAQPGNINAQMNIKRGRVGGQDLDTEGFLN